MSRVTVLGGGGFGLAAAAHLALEGHEVTLLFHPGECYSELVESRAIRLSGALGQREVSLAMVTGNPAEAVPGREVILFAAPGAWYEDSSRLIAPFVEDGQLLLVNRGLAGVALRLATILEATRTTARLLIGEMGGQAYVARELPGGGRDGSVASVNPAAVEVLLISRPTMFAAMPSADTPEAMAIAQKLYPGLSAARNVLETSLSGLSAILYPPPVLLNAAAIQRSGGQFGLFREGTTPAVAEVMHAVDEERMTLLRTLGLGAVGLLDGLASRGHLGPEAAEGQSFYAAFQAGGPLQAVPAPSTLEDHDFLDAIGSGLVPLSELGGLLGVGTPVVDGLVTLGSLVTGRSYRSVGLTLDRMGLPREPWKLETFLATGRR